VLLSDKDLVNR